MTQKSRTTSSDLPQARVARAGYPAFTRLDHNRATVEEFDRERMGIAAKE